MVAIFGVKLAPQGVVVGAEQGELLVEDRRRFLAAAAQRDAGCRRRSAVRRGAPHRAQRLGRLRQDRLRHLPLGALLHEHLLGLQQPPFGERRSRRGIGGFREPAAGPPGGERDIPRGVHLRVHLPHFSLDDDARRGCFVEVVLSATRGRLRGRVRRAGPEARGGASVGAVGERGHLGSLSHLTGGGRERARRARWVARETGRSRGASRIGVTPTRG